MTKIINKIYLLLAYVIIFLYIVGANAFTYQIASSFQVKLAEIISIPIILIFFSIKIIKGKRISINIYEKSILIWLFFSFISAIYGYIRFNYNSALFFKGIFYSVRIILLLMTINFIKIAFDSNNISLEKFLDILINMYLLVCLIGFFQFIFYPDGYHWHQIFWNLGTYRTIPDPHKGRLISTYMDPNFLSCCLLIPLSISINQWVRGKKKQLFISIIFSITILLTISRSGFLGLVILIWLVFYKKSYKKKEFIRNSILILVFIISIIVLFLQNSRITQRVINSLDDGSTFSRFDSWNYTINIFRYSPLLGIGYNLFDAFSSSILSNSIYYLTENGSDSSILLILISSGVIGTFYFFYHYHKLLIKNELIKSEIYKRIIFQISISALVLCNFNNLLFYVLWQFPFFLLIKMVKK